MINDSHTDFVLDVSSRGQNVMYKVIFIMGPMAESRPMSSLQKEFTVYLIPYEIVITATLVLVLVKFKICVIHIIAVLVIRHSYLDCLLFNINVHSHDLLLTWMVY